MERIRILGIEINNVTLEEALSFCTERIEQKEKTKVYTPNAEILVESVRDRSFEELLKKGDLLVPDGVGLIKTARFYKKRFKEKVAGVDLTFAILKEAEMKGFSVYLLGGKPEILPMALEGMKERFPALKISGAHHGYFSEEEVPELIEEINLSGAEIMIVALGMKKQEAFINDHLEETGCSLGIGVGGTIDILAGTANRAPEFFIKHGLEWLYRLLKQPKRFFRMLDLPRFVFLCFVDALYRQEEDTNETVI